MRKTFTQIYARAAVLNGQALSKSITLSCMFALILGFAAQVQAQDDPCTAASLTFPSTCGATTSLSVSLVGATPTTTPAIPTGCPSGVSFAGLKDKWFKFTAPAVPSAINLSMSWSGCSGFFCVDNPGFAIYGSSGLCSAGLTLLDCQGDNGAFASGTLNLTYTGLTAGETYYCRVWEDDNQGGTVAITATFVAPNDACVDALPFGPNACNYGATNTNEPNSWVPSSPNCPTWGTMDNAVWYTFTVTASTPQPITITINNVSCVGSNLQVGIWSNSNSCNLASETFYACKDGTGTLTLGPVTLPVGNYYLLADGDGGSQCTWTFASPQLLPVATNDGPKCVGQDIHLMASSTTGTAPFTYAWAGPSGFTSTSATPTLTAVTAAQAGTYTVTITDATATTATGTTVVSVFAAPPLTTTPTQPTCMLVNGAITANGAATYNWGAALGAQQNNATITSLAVGTYTVTATEAAHSCTATASVTLVNVGTPPTVSITPTAPTCGKQNGSLTISGANSYNWGATLGAQQFNSSLTNLAAATYTVTATESAHGCTTTAQSTLTNIGTPPTLTNTNAQPTCGATNGTISLSGANTYNWGATLGAQQFNSNLTNLAPATYTVTATETVNGCTTTAQFVLTNVGTAPVVTSTVTQPTCGLNNGGISVGGANTYNWGAALGAQQNNAVLTNLSPATYTVTATESAHACTATAQFTLTNTGTTPIIVTTTTQPTCAAANGVISVTSPSGAGVAYTWSANVAPNTTNGSSVSGLEQGSYIVTVTQSGCSSSTTVVVNAPTPLPSITTNIVAATCGSSDGGASVVSPAAGSGATYQWSANAPPAQATSASLTMIASGTYTVTVTQAGCASSSQVVVPCSVAVCNVTAVVASAISSCNNNGTANVAADDYYTATITVTYTGAQAGSTMTLNSPNLSVPVAALSATTGNGSVTFTNVHFKANGLPTSLTANLTNGVTACAGNTNLAAVAACACGASTTMSWN